MMSLFLSLRDAQEKVMQESVEEMRIWDRTRLGEGKKRQNRPSTKAGRKEEKRKGKEPVTMRENTEKIE